MPQHVIHFPDREDPTSVYGYRQQQNRWVVIRIEDEELMGTTGTEQQAQALIVQLLEEGEQPEEELELRQPLNAERLGEVIPGAVSTGQQPQPVAGGLVEFSR